MSAEQARDEHSGTLAYRKLEELRAFTGERGEFWTRFLQVALAFGPATDAVVLTRLHSPEAGLGTWKDTFCWPPQSQLFAQMRLAKDEFDRSIAEAETGGGAIVNGLQLLVVRLMTGDLNRTDLLAIRLQPDANPPRASTRLRLLADLPLLFERGQALAENDQALGQARNDLERFAVTLDLLVVLNTQTRFPVAAMSLCNELAARLRCERVSLGWLEHGCVRLQALSHTLHFERKMELISAIESVMDEAFDQDEEVAWPAPPGCTAVVRDHEAFARSKGIGCLLSLPIRLDDAGLGALTLERANGEFTLREQQVLRLLCDHMARRLHELKQRDRWWGARLLTAARGKAEHLIGPEHTGAKLSALGVALLLGVLLFGSMEYRIEAPFILKTDYLAQLAAPFDGYLDEVHVRIGDPVSVGQPLLALDPRELLIQEAAAIAEGQRFSAEAQKAEALGNIGDMRIARASAEEAQARLEITQHHLGKAVVLAPFSGYVVEGDLRERISAPVKQGEVLVKVARLDAMYAEVAMPEADIHEIHAGQSTEIAFASQPQFTFPLRIERVEPVADAREKGNVFVVRAEFATAAQPWWRPGMSGVCKVSVGRRNVLWILTHRTVDFLRLHFWW